MDNGRERDREREWSVETMDSWANNADRQGDRDRETERETERELLMGAWLVCFICSAIGFTTANQTQPTAGQLPRQLGSWGKLRKIRGENVRKMRKLLLPCRDFICRGCNCIFE